METSEFGSHEKMIYLDYAATTPTDTKVIEAMLPYFRNIYGNPSAVHPLGREARDAVETARDKVAELIGAESNEITFTSGGTEANNLAIFGVAAACAHQGKHIITTKIEHHSVLEVCHALEKRGYNITYLPVDTYGIVSPDTVRTAITNETILISVMAANNVVGTLQPINEIGVIAREHDILLHTDAVQVAGHLPLDVKRDNIDLLSISAHKFFGPNGIGALYAGRNVHLVPIIYGGGQEEGLRSGTENVSGIVGFGKAAEIAMLEMTDEAAHVTALRNDLIRGILDCVPDSILNGHPEKRLPSNVNVSIQGVEGEYLTKELGASGICVSTGSACSSAIHEAPYVLLAMDVNRDLANCSIRLSLGKLNSKTEIERVLNILSDVVSRIRDYQS